MKTTKHQILIKVVLILISFPGFAQVRTIEGIVTDQNGKPIMNATITPKGTDKFAKTDENGYYKCDSVPELIITLFCTHPDMEPASASIGIYNKIDIRMSKLGSEDFSDMSLEDLLNMSTTTVSKSSEKMSDAPGVISVISSDELSRFGGNTLKDILERMPSLIGSTVYMTDRSTIAPRGDQVQPSSSHVLLLINGRPTREVLEGGIKSELYESLPVNNIEKIEVIRGPGSVLYGSNAFSAVINVITKETDKSFISLSGIGGLPGDYTVAAEGGIKAGDLQVNVAGKYFKKKEWETDYSYAVPGSATGDTTVKISIPNEGVGSYLDIKYKNIRLMSSFNQWENYYFVPDYAFIFPAYGNAKWQKSFTDLGYKLKVTDKLDMDFNATYSSSTFSQSSWPYTNRNSYELIGEWTNFWRITEKLKVIMGGLYNYQKGKEFTDEPTGEDVTTTDDSKNGVAAYAQVDYSGLKWAKIIAGIQANKVEDLDLDFNPRVGVIIYPYKNFNIKALYSQAFRAPSINELGINHPAMMGKNNLKPEKVNTIDLGINYTGEKVYVGLNGFYSMMNNIIYQDRSGKYEVPTYDNIGEVDIMGLEVEGKYYISHNLFFMGSLLYQINEDKDGNENVTPISSFGIKGGLSYQSKSGITASLFNIYQGNLDDSYKTTLNPSPGAYNLLNMYLNFNMVKLLKLDLKQDFSLFIQGDNLLGEEIWLPAWGLTMGSSIPKNNGRTLYLGIKITF